MPHGRWRSGRRLRTQIPWPQTRPAVEHRPWTQRQLRPPRPSAREDLKTPDSLRRSRVPDWWSMMPTTRNRVALKSPWASRSAESGERGVGSAQAHHHGEEAELAHRAVSKDQFDVGLPQRPVPAYQHRCQAQPKDQRQPVGGFRKTRVPAGPRCRCRPSPWPQRAGMRSPGWARPWLPGARSGREPAPTW